ncbi:hypothetical protein ACIQH5_11105, partial [Paenarthrobacter sp. NPDC091711]|uniref:hypothetical protein n=1 Tax=Paenarthrobacter sp. NPDC091711 TaxID=3364385 RepID=UPI0037F1DA8E
MKDIMTAPYADLDDRRFVEDPVGYLRELAGLSPIVLTARGNWVVDGSFVDKLAGDSRLVDIHGGVLAMLLNQHDLQQEALSVVSAVYLSNSGVTALRGHIREIVTDLLDQCPSDRPVQFYDDVCSHVPPRLFCRMVGVSEKSGPSVIRAASALQTVLSRDPAPDDVFEAAYGDLYAFVEELVAEKRLNIGSDLISQLLRAERAGRMTEQQVHDMVVMLLEASTDNTSHQMAMAVAEILEHRDQ